MFVGSISFFIFVCGRFNFLIGMSENVYICAKERQRDINAF